MSSDGAFTFTPAHERARHARLVSRIREGTLREPTWVLCPREPLRAALEDRVARAGGAFARFHDWDHLARALDELLSLEFTTTPDETERALAVERCLAARATAHPDLADPLRSDPFGVALALLRVVDTLRLHHWDGTSRHAIPHADDRASRLVASHVALLGDVTRELDAHLSARSMLDTIARLRRALEALRAGATLPRTHLYVEGIDRLAPLERDLLLALRDAGVEVDVAPWVEGYPHDPDHPDALALPTNDLRLLDALDSGAARCGRDDASVAAVTVRDPYEEAEQIARWIAEHVARGANPEDFAVHVSSEAGAVDRMRRALARYGVAGNGVGATPVRQSVLWQVLRASVRLGWQGVDIVDLATVLSAPGSGVWGSDRDWLCAQLRREVPTTWQGVREVLHRATEPAAQPAPTPRAADELEAVALDDEPAPVTVDPARAKQLMETRKRVEELVAMWEREGPLSRRAPHERLGALGAVVELTLKRFLDTMRFSEAIEDPRTQTAWIAAAQSITAACKAALERLARSGASLPPHAPGVFLGSAESLLGVTLDAPSPARADGVALLVDDPFPRARPKVLVVAGFHRGRFPSPVARPLVLGPLERELLGAAGGDLSRLPGEVELGALAWRETLRVLALPTERLLLVAPKRTSAGADVDVSLAWRDLLARLPAEARKARDRLGVPRIREWQRAEFSDGPRSPRGRLRDAIEALGEARVDDAVALGTPLATGARSARDLFMARFRPEMRFDVGDLVRSQLTTAVFTPRSLETLLKCRYSFLTGALLGLTPLRLARSPSITAQDRTRVTRAALRALDVVASSGRAPTDDDAKRALEDAITAEVPWADRGDARLALEDLRRTVSHFLRRYLELRAAWRLDFANDATKPDDAKPVRLALPSARVPLINLAPVSPRVEMLVATGPDGEEARALVMDLKLGSTSTMTKLRDAGLDLDAALIPKILAAQRKGGAEVAAFVRLSLTKPDGELLAKTADAKASYENVATTTVVTIDRARPLDGFAEVTLLRVGETFEALSSDAAAEYAPHDAARRAELEGVGAKSCEYCAMRLGCRFKMAGGFE